MARPTKKVKLEGERKYHNPDFLLKHAEELLNSRKTAGGKFAVSYALALAEDYAFSQNTSASEIEKTMGRMNAFLESSRKYENDHANEQINKLLEKTEDEEQVEEVNKGKMKVAK